MIAREIGGKLIEVYSLKKMQHTVVEACLAAVLFSLNFAVSEGFLPLGPCS